MTGEDIVLSKWIGLKGTALIAKEKKEELSEEFSPFFAESAIRFGDDLSVETETEIAEKAGATAVLEVKDGGIYRALWDIAEELDTGLQVFLRSIPVKQETIEIANHFDIDPYKLLSGGALIMITPRGHDLAEMLMDTGINAAVIGRTDDTRDRVILNKDIRRFISPRDRDEIYKIPGIRLTGE